MKAAVFNDVIHPQIHEASGMEQGVGVSGLSESVPDTRRADSSVLLGAHVDRWIARADYRKQSFDTFRIHCISVVKDDCVPCERRQIRHRIFAAPWFHGLGS